MNLSERLTYWAQNEEMIDQHFTAHGRDCNDAVYELGRLQAENNLLQAAQGTLKQRLDACRAENAKLKAYVEKTAEFIEGLISTGEIVEVVKDFRSDFPKETEK